MANVKKTLPRHTNLANQGLRIACFIFDSAVMLAYSLPLYFSLGGVFHNRLTRYETVMNNYVMRSGLGKELVNGEVKYMENAQDEASYNEYFVRLKYYYFNYLVGVAPTNESEYYPEKYYAAPNYDTEFKYNGEMLKPIEYYTVDWFNTNVLEITDEDPNNDKSSSLFTYVPVENPSDDNKYDKSKIGIPREHYYDAESNTVKEVTYVKLSKLLESSYRESVIHLRNQSFYKPIKTRLNLVYSFIVFVSGSLAYFFSFVFVPLIRKDGATFGKMIIGLRLANNLGYKHKKWQILLRAVPFYVTFTALCFIPFGDIEILLLMGLVILLVSFTLMMASPKRVSLHDLTAGTIVVDRKTSIIFDTSADEIAYSMKEDGLVDEKGNVIENS